MICVLKHRSIIIRTRFNLFTDDITGQYYFTLPRLITYIKFSIKVDSHQTYHMLKLIADNEIYISNTA